jgi:RNA polymerase sigma factor (TIGR02999 family)
MSDISQHLAAMRDGDERALNELFAITYRELRDLAHARLRSSVKDNGLNTTALVHESYLRLTRARELSLEDRAHFLGYVARVMRSVVVDFARERLAQRRGGAMLFVTMTTNIPDLDSIDAEQVVQIEDALQLLGQTEERLVRVVEMKFFAGLSIEEIASNLNIAGRTVRRDWDKARMLLFAALSS